MKDRLRGGVAEVVMKIYDLMGQRSDCCRDISVLRAPLLSTVKCSHKAETVNVFTKYILKNQFQESERTMRDSIILDSSLKKETETDLQMKHL